MDGHITPVYYLLCGAVGIVAAVCMAGFVLGCKHYNLIPVNGIRAIGRSFTRSDALTLAVGWQVHLIMGFVFGLLYRQLLFVFGITNPILLVTTCIAFGFAHGLVVSFIVVIDVGEYSEAERYREQGLQLGTVYWAAHMIYGTIVGIGIVSIESLAR